MEKELTLLHSKMLLETPGGKSGAVVLFLPGISGKALSDRFQPLVDLVLKEQLHIARLDAWENEANVQKKTLKAFDEELKSALSELKKCGYTDVILIGKSFGGGLSLAHHDPLISKKILWAPAIGVSEEGTYLALKETKLEEVEKLLDVKLKTEDIHNDPAEICIVHGINDEAIPLRNSETIIKASQGGELKTIEGADHSFKTPEMESALLEATKEFLRN